MERCWRLVKRVSLLLFITSLGLITLSIIQRHQRSLVVTKAPTVLGESIQRVESEPQCFSVDHYLQQLEKYRPYLELLYNTEVKKIPMEKIIACRQHISTITQTDWNCPQYQIEFNRACVKQLLEKEFVFEQQEELLRSATSHVTVSVRISDDKINTELLVNETMKKLSEDTTSGLFLSQFSPIRSIQVITPVDKDLPNTDGKIAKRYLEFDGSRQLLFLWEDGEYTKYGMSGAFPNYNPVGVHYILNKSPLAWSSTANKWMPYWMAFTYDRKQQAMLGIHGLVYWYPGYTREGTKKIFEPETNIGKPRSTGCLRLTVSDAKKIFQWAKVGDMVVVHN